MRLFVAVVPPEDVLEDLAEHVAPRREASAQLRWADPEQWHLTLAFLGEVPELVLDPLCEGLHRASGRLDAVQLALTGAGAFPHAAAAKVLWLGVRDDSAASSEAAGMRETSESPETPETREAWSTPGLQRWVGTIRPTCNHAGAPPDGQAFLAHLTLARSGRPFEATRLVRAFAGYESPTWSAASFELIRSHLGQGRGRRPRYEVIERFRVGRDAWA